MANLDDFSGLLSREHGLCVVATTRADGTVQSSVVNAGVMTSPLDGEPCVAFVAAGRSQKLANLRARPQITVTARVSWEWCTVEGTGTSIGPDDPASGYDAEAIRVLLREVFVAAGGTHDDWDEYDRVMAAERRTAVIVKPARVYSNG